MKTHKPPTIGTTAIAAFAICATLGAQESALAQGTPATPVSTPPLEACQVIAYSHQRTIYLLTSSGARCQAGAPMRFKLYRLNDFVVEQACDFSKTINRIAAEDAVDERVMCAHSGSILEPERRGGYSGIVLRYGHRVNGTIEALPAQ